MNKHERERLEKERSVLRMITKMDIKTQVLKCIEKQGQAVIYNIIKKIGEVDMKMDSHNNHIKGMVLTRERIYIDGGKISKEERDYDFSPNVEDWTWELCDITELNKVLVLASLERENA